MQVGILYANLHLSFCCQRQESPVVIVYVRAVVAVPSKERVADCEVAAAGGEVRGIGACRAETTGLGLDAKAVDADVAAQMPYDSHPRKAS